MIKLQMVLNPTLRAEIDENDFSSKLVKLGISVTGRGLATISAEISADAFKQIWGDPPTEVSGFVTKLENKALTVPPKLAPLVESITTVPRHSTF